MLQSDIKDAWRHCGRFMSLRLPGSASRLAGVSSSDRHRFYRRSIGCQPILIDRLSQSIRLKSWVEAPPIIAQGLERSPLSAC